ncbi:MAG: glycosyltransferase [Hyphomicrobiales bacterium]|nr:glycosyltransferase [Hyphomicrobiales bacterium]MCP5374255.1 glycosyltransferase [Hyphomicrobiales bacterium]
MADKGKGRVLVTTSTLPCLDNDGEPRFVLDLSRALQAHFDVTILAPAHPCAPMRHELSGVPVVRYRYAPSRRWEVLSYPGAIGPRLRRNPALWPLVPALFAGLRQATARLIADGGFDCVHSHWALPQGFVQSTLAGRAGAPPYVVTMHGGDIYTTGTLAKSLLVRRALRGAAAVTVVSAALKAHLMEGPLRGVLDREPAVIPMGCDLGAFARHGPGGGPPAGLDPARPLILFVGRLAEKKGLPVLLRAMAGDGLGALGATLAIAGDGPMRGELEALVERLGLRQRVRLLGSVAHRDLPALYAAADVFCAPFVVARDGDTEGLPTVLSEAGAAGLASVVGDVGGVREIIEDGVNGLVVPSGDVPALAAALCRVLGDADLRRCMAAAARERACGYDWQCIGERFAEILGGAMAGERPGKAA